MGCCFEKFIKRSGVNDGFKMICGDYAWNMGFSKYQRYVFLDRKLEWPQKIML